MARRPDLLELGADALTALANPGFVKRALKDVAEGRIPAIAEGADGSISATYDDGHRAVLRADRTLRDAECSCPASGLCRHRVTLVPAYQHWVRAQAPAAAPASAAEPTQESELWSPAHFDDAALAAGVPAATLDRARRMAAARPVVRLGVWRAEAPVPTARLPMCSVSFFSRSSLLHARCDCKQGSGCEHVVLAVWAFRQLGADAVADGVLELAPPTDAAGTERRFDAPAIALCDAIGELLLRLWLDGSSQPPLALDAAFEQTTSAATARGWCWIADTLDALREALAAQHARSSRFDPAHLLALVAELDARLAAARYADATAAAAGTVALPAGEILGIGVKGEVALDHLRLVSLGVACWTDATHEGARVLFADPDVQTVTVLERRWPRADGTSLPTRRVLGMPLRQLAASQVVTRAATRRANGLVDVASGARQTNALPLSPQSWDGLRPPLRQPDASALIEHLRNAAPDFVRPRHAVEHVHVLPVSRVIGWGWDAAAQTLHAQLLCNARSTAADDAAGADVDDENDSDIAHITLPHDTAAPGAVDALAHVLAGTFGAPRAIAGIARLEAGRLHLTPTAALTEQRAVVLQVEAPSALSLPLAALAALPLRTAAVDAVRNVLAQWLRQGLRHLGHAALERARSEAQRLADAGYAIASTLLQEIVADVSAAQRRHLPTRLAQLILLLDGIRR